MTLRRKLREVFLDHNLSNFPIAHAIDDVMARTASLTRQYIILAACSGFLLGFGLCLLWYGAQVSAIHDTLAAWKEADDNHYRTAHDMRPVSKGLAQVIVQRKADARRVE